MKGGSVDITVDREAEEQEEVEFTEGGLEDLLTSGKTGNEMSTNAGSYMTEINTCIHPPFSLEVGNSDPPRAKGLPPSTSPPPNKTIFCNKRQQGRRPQGQNCTRIIRMRV